MATEFEPTLFVFDELDWVDERREPGAAAKLIEEAERTGARRKRISRGEGGFFHQFTTMPAGFEVPMHSHDHDELFIVLSGGCTFWPDGPDRSVELKARDSVALAAQAGADMINLSVGMLGSIMVASPESLVIDNDMCGAILRSVRGIDINSASLDVEAIERVVSGDGHFLGEPQTLALMKSEYQYPSLADRQSVADWLASGAESIWERAQARVDGMLANDRPDHLSRDAEARIRQEFDIRLGQEN